MTNKVDVTVEGGDLLDRMLVDLPIELRDRVMPKAMRAAATIVQKAAQSNINNNRDGRKPPGLARTIIIKVKQYDYTTTAIVGPAYLGVNHAHLLEFGHRLVRKIRDADGSVRKVEIGFVKAHPFLRPAADETIREQRDAIIKIVTEALAEYRAA
jgi:HK97 gp10 family phage protein